MEAFSGSPTGDLVVASVSHFLSSARSPATPPRPAGAPPPSMATAATRLSSSRTVTSCARRPSGSAADLRDCRSSSGPLLGLHCLLCDCRSSSVRCSSKHSAVVPVPEPSTPRWTGRRIRRLHICTCSPQPGFLSSFVAAYCRLETRVQAHNAELLVSSCRSSYVGARRAKERGPWQRRSVLLLLAFPVEERARRSRLERGKCISMVDMQRRKIGAHTKEEIMWCFFFFILIMWCFDCLFRGRSAGFDCVLTLKAEMDGEDKEKKI